MNLLISDFDGDRQMVVPLDGTIAEEMVKQFECFSKDRAQCDRELAVFAQELSEALLEVLRRKCQPPTPGNIKFATVIARSLKIDLPADALASRMSMDRFLQKYAPRYRELQSRDRVA